MELGLRVVRGPDWKWGDQDGGEGHVGTVVEIGRYNSPTIPFKTVVVQWDTGSRSNYRVGYQGAYDLRVFDNAPCGAYHRFRCSECQCEGIIGMRWHCLTCISINLCTACYMRGSHNLDHVFVRKDTSYTSGVDLPQRSLNNTVRIQARGIFRGARVVRGHDWDWNNQDGGAGKVGEVIDIRGWDKQSRRSVASVKWPKTANVYRVGHKGKVDLKCVVDASGGYYYRDHLPILGQIIANPLDQKRPTETQLQETSGLPSHQTRIPAASIMSEPCPFKIGDRVQVVVTDENILKEMQRGHGGWNPRMAPLIGRVGVVHRITDSQDVRVMFDDCRNRWTFNPNALRRLERFSVGELVQILDDEDQVRNLQKSHGEWIDIMRSSLGKTGKITKIYSDGDLRVCIDGKTWTINPLCVIRPGAESSNDALMEERKKQRGPMWVDWMSEMSSMQDEEEDLSRTFSNDKKETSNGKKPSFASGCSSSDNQSKPEANINVSVDITLPPKESINDVKCLICDENFANLQFLPCSHQVCCSECSSRMKKCLSCKQVIQKLLYIDQSTREIYAIMDRWSGDSNINNRDSSSSASSAVASARQPEDESLLVDKIEVHQRLKYLESKIIEIEEANTCGICLERIKNVIFLCGHGACVDCANTLVTCHMCRKTIRQKINIY